MRPIDRTSSRSTDRRGPRLKSSAAVGSSFFVSHSVRIGSHSQEALDLWYRLSDYAYVVILLCEGGSQTLAEALITLRFLENLVSDARH